MLRSCPLLEPARFALCALSKIKKKHCALLNKENRKSGVTSPHSSATLGAGSCELNESSGGGPRSACTVNPA
jgi:hypothetical protein